jgi:hypothetical protein
MAEILKPRWMLKLGCGFGEDGKLIEREGKEQATTPEDPKLLEKLGIKKGEKVLAIAGFYASWASQIARAGAKVDYNDIAKDILDFTKEKYEGLFGEYILSNYELIPKKPLEYDWTFTFEACGGGSGLPIAYLRSLLNKKGGILVLFTGREDKGQLGSKPKKYPLILNTLAQIYGCKSEVREVMFEGHRMGREHATLAHLVYTIKTNNSARKKVEQDLRVLEEVENLEVINNKADLDSLKRLDKLCRGIEKDFIKEVEVKC